MRQLTDAGAVGLCILENESTGLSEIGKWSRETGKNDIHIMLTWRKTGCVALMIDANHGYDQSTIRTAPVRNIWNTDSHSNNSWTTYRTCFYVLNYELIDVKHGLGETRHTSVQKIYRERIFSLAATSHVISDFAWQVQLLEKHYEDITETNSAANTWVI